MCHDGRMAEPDEWPADDPDRFEDALDYLAALRDEIAERYLLEWNRAGWPYDAEWIG